MPNQRSAAYAGRTRRVALRAAGAVLALGAVGLLLYWFAHPNPGGEVAESRTAPVAAGVEAPVVVERGSGAAQAVADEAEDCVDDPMAHPRLASIQMESALSGFRQALEDDGYGRLEIDLVTDAAVAEATPRSAASLSRVDADAARIAFGALGIVRSETEDGARAEAALADNRPRPMPVYSRTGQRILRVRDGERFERALDAGGLPEVLSLLYGKPDRLRYRWGGTNLFGRLLRHAPSRFEGLTANELADLPLGAHELAVAIEAGLPAADVERWLDAAAFDALPEVDRSKLARAAALRGRPDVLRSLIHRGAEPTAAAGSVLDDLAAALPTALKEDADYREVVRLLLAAGDRPYLRSTMARLPAIPDAAPLALQPESLTAWRRPDLQERAAAYSELHREWTARLAAAEAAQGRCLDSAAALPDSPSAEAGIAARLNYEEALERTYHRSLTESPQYAEAVRMLAEFESAQQNGTLAADVLQQLDAYERLLDLAYDGRWPEALALAAETGADYGRLLGSALTTGAPLEVIVDLADRSGAPLPEDAMTTLARYGVKFGHWSGAVERARSLALTHGLDVHYVNEDGHNALALAVERFYGFPYMNQVNRDSFELVEFLLDESVATQPTAGGLDAIDRILLKALDSPTTAPPAAVFVRYLLDRGSSVRLSHRQIMRLMATANADAYARLIAAVPELAT